MSPGEQQRIGVEAGLADPDAYFVERDLTLTCSEADGFWWTDLVVNEGLAVERYSRGVSEADAKASAVRRWANEQEPDA